MLLDLFSPQLPVRSAFLDGTRKRAGWRFCNGERVTPPRAKGPVGFPNNTTHPGRLGSGHGQAPLALAAREERI
jgi:hypothetical protein